MALRDSEFETMVKNDKTELFHPSATPAQFENLLHSKFLTGIQQVNTKVKQKTLMEHLLSRHESETDSKGVENLVRKVIVLLDKGATFSHPNFETVLLKILHSNMNSMGVEQKFFAASLKNKNSGNVAFEGRCDAMARVACDLTVDFLQANLPFIQQIFSVFSKASVGLKRGYDVDTTVMIKMFGAFQEEYYSEGRVKLDCARQILEKMHQSKKLQLTDRKGPDQRNVLHIAVMLDSAVLCEYICSCDIVTFNHKDACGRTPVFYCSSAAVVQGLMKLPQVECNLKDKNKQTVTHFTLTRFTGEKRAEILGVLTELLRNTDVDASALDKDGRCVFLRLLNCKGLKTELKQSICQVLQVIVERDDFSLLSSGPNGETLLDIITEKKLFCIFSILANAGKICKISLRTSATKKQPLVHQVAMGGELEDFMALLQHPRVSEHVNELDSTGKSLLFHTVKLGCVEKTKAVLQLPMMDPNVCDSEGNTSLHWLAQEDQFSADGLKYLLETNGVDVNRCNNKGETCLIVAAGYNNVQFLQSLPLDSQRMKLEVKDLNGKDALRIATEEKFLAFIKILLKHRLSHRTLGGALITASKIGSSEVLKLIIAHKACDVNYQDTDRKCALHIVVKKTNIEAIHALLNHKDIDLSKQDDDGYTPLMYGVTKLKVDDVQPLLEKTKEHHLHIQNRYKQTVKDVFDEMPDEKKDPKLMSLIYKSMQKIEDTRRLSLTDTGVGEALFNLRQAIQNKATFTESDQAELLFNVSYMENLCSTILKQKYANRAGMTDQHKKRLLEYRTLLVEELEPRELTDYLIEKHIITEDQEDEILSFRTRRSRVQALLVMLPRCGPTAFEEFINALRKACQGHVADAMLDPSMKSEKALVARTKDNAVFNLLTSVTECLLLFSDQGSGQELEQRKLGIQQ